MRFDNGDDDENEGEIVGWGKVKERRERGWKNLEWKKRNDASY